ncbi:hypothetical protein T07_8425 [Trichinella nelsoni]|uniref:Uncharacterized protein n=1 Tax=Trichinella nelsoni TaxID=6336 RepID=A0A0V0RUU0_9BILA|nr:hypothetical protein T07_8425 [Trichinella nelsoni]
MVLVKAACRGSVAQLWSVCLGPKRRWRLHWKIYPTVPRSESTPAPRCSLKEKKSESSSATVGNILAAGQLSSMPTDKAAMEKPNSESVAPVDQWNEVSTNAKEDSGAHGASKTKIETENGAEMEVDEKVVEKENRHRFVTARFQHYHHQQQQQTPTNALTLFSFSLQVYIRLR